MWFVVFTDKERRECWNGRGGRGSGMEPVYSKTRTPAGAFSSIDENTELSRVDGNDHIIITIHFDLEMLPPTLQHHVSR